MTTTNARTRKATVAAGAARKATTSATVTPIKKAAPRAASKAAPAAAPAADAPAAPAGDLMSQLAGGATVAKALPKSTRTSTSAANAFTPLMRKSFEDGVPMTLPTMPNDPETVKKVYVAIRRAATLEGVGVAIRAEVKGDNISITFGAKTRQARASK